MRSLLTRFQVPQVLRNRSFIFFLFSRVGSSLASQMLAVAVGWQMYALTHSAFYLGMVGLAQFLPMIILTLVVGHVADCYDRRRIIRVCQFVEGMGVIVLAVGCQNGWLTKEGILLTLVVWGAAHAFEGPSLQAMLPGLVTTELFPSATALSTSLFQTASIIGPALGGILYAVGPTVVFFVISLMLFGAAGVIGLVRIEWRTAKHEPVNSDSLFAGITFIRSQPVILGAISLDLFAVLLGGATALLPIYAREILKIGPSGLGILRSAPAIGALLVSLLLARHPLKRRVGRTMFFAVLVFGLATVIFAVSSSFLLSLAALVLLGASDVISVVIRSSLVQLGTPDAMRGRVSAVNSMFIGTSNQLGEFESGLTAAWFGVVPAALIGGIGTILVVLLWNRLFPALFHTDTLQKES